jgi:hypothetical protein
MKAVVGISLAAVAAPPQRVSSTNRSCRSRPPIRDVSGQRVPSPQGRSASAAPNDSSIGRSSERGVSTMQPANRGASLSASQSPRSLRRHHLVARTRPSGATWRRRSKRVAPRGIRSVPAQRRRGRMGHLAMDLRGSSARMPRPGHVDELGPASQRRGPHWPHQRRSPSRSLPKRR